MASVATINTYNYAYAYFGNANSNANGDCDADSEYIKNPYYVSETDIDSIIKKNTSFNVNENEKIIIPPTVYKINTPAGGICTAFEAMENDNDNDNDSIASSVCSSCYPDSSEEDNIIPLTPNESVISSPDNSRPNSIISYSLPEDFCTGVTRSIMYEYLIKYFHEFTDTNNKQKIVEFLSTQLMCDCTDCGGYDSFCECEIESEYEKHFGVIVQYNEV
jgi:hypothetical protein